jgi:hypothetical protein
MATLKQPWGEHLRTPAGFHWAKRGILASRPTLDDKVVLMGAGDATTRLSVGTNADKRFFDFYTESAALSGDSRGIYWQHFLSGAGATGDCARFFAKVNIVGVAGAFGTHSTVQIQDDAGVGITGLAAGARATLAAEADTRSLTGTLTALQVDSDVGANNTLPGTNSFIRVADNGSVSLDNLFDIPATGCITGSNIKARIGGAAAVIPFTDTSLQDAGVILAGTGTSGTPATTAVADKAFYKFYTESTATSGDSRGIYWQHFLSGNGATGDCARFFAKVNSATVAGGFGTHSTVQIQTGSGVTGLANGVRATLAAQSESRTLTGTLAALQVDSDVGASNTLPGITSFIRVADNNSVKIPNLFHFAAGNVVANTTETASTQAGSIKVDVEGTTKYIALYTTSA